MRIQNCSSMALPVTFIVAGAKRSALLMPGQAIEADEVVGPVANGIKATSANGTARAVTNTTPPADKSAA